MTVGQVIEMISPNTVEKKRKKKHSQLYLNSEEVSILYKNHLFLFSECGCSLIGTKEGTFCDKVNAKCDCKEGYTSRDCGNCADGYFWNSETKQCQGDLF